MMEEKIYIQGVGWIRRVTKKELMDYIYRNSFARDCINTFTRVGPAQWEWYHFN